LRPIGAEKVRLRALPGFFLLEDGLVLLEGMPQRISFNQPAIGVELGHHLAPGGAGIRQDLPEHTPDGRAPDRPVGASQDAAERSYIQPTAERTAALKATHG
jgi:hypothetical protein